MWANVLHMVLPEYLPLGTDPKHDIHVQAHLSDDYHLSGSIENRGEPKQAITT